MLYVVSAHKTKDDAFPSQATAYAKFFNKFLVIDGQQRLTTVSIVLTVLRDLMDTSSADRVNDYLVNRHYQGPDRLKLLPTQADGDQIVYKQLVVDRTMPAPAGESFIKPAYDYFKRKMQGDHDGKPVEPGRVLEIIEQRLEVVLISLGQGDDPYLIFESLNAKGQKLTQADLVRNYILMKFGHSLEPGGEQERIYESYWKPLEESLKDKEPKYWLTTFLRHFCMKDGTSVQKDAVYSGIRSRLASKEVSEIETNLKEIKSLGDFYARFIDPTKEPNIAIRSRLVAFNALDVTTCYPLLLRLFASYSSKTISQADLEQCLHLIESFVVRRAVCAVPPNSLGKLFTQWCSYYSETNIVIWLGSEMAKGSGNSRWPNDAQFRSDFQTREQYGRKSTKHVLASIEAGFDHKEPADLNTATIEHLMPQELTPEWKLTLGSDYEDAYDRLLHTFGNLTLTGYNPELSNLPFDQKQRWLSTSHIELNRWICEQGGWNATIIETRAKILADAATKIWLGPESFS